MLPLLLATALAAAPAPESFLARYAATRGFRAGLPTRAALAPDGRAAVFLRSGPRSAVQALYETDLASGETRTLATAESLLGGAGETRTAAEQARLERQRIVARGITGFELSRDGARVLVSLGGTPYVLDRTGGAATAVSTAGRALDVRFSPDGRAVAYVAGHELRVLDLATGADRSLTPGGTADVHFGDAEFVAQEEFGRERGFWWSPDGRSLAFQETDEREVERFTIHDPLHPERPADVFRYPRAGRPNAGVRLGVVAATGGPPVWISFDRERWPYVAAVSWEEGAPLSIVVLDRRQREVALLAADPATGTTRLLVREADAAWIHVTEGFPLWRRDGKAFFWHTERNGWPEVELRRADGSLARTWVRGDAGFARLVGYDDRRQALWFLGGPDPAQTRLYRVTAGRAPVEFAPAKEPVALRASVSRNGDVLLVSRASFAGVDAPAAFRRDGQPLARLPSVAERAPFGVNGELRRVAAGPGLQTLVVRPRDAQPGRKLPVLLHVYGGPLFQAASVSPDPLNQWLADQGFLVVAIDGRGTPRRGRAFERAIQGDLGGPALEDQIAALEALAREVPELDRSRIGVFGWSFGGYMAALAVLKHPETFRAAVAGAPVTDWLDYDTAYAERYLGLPAEAPEAYRRSSLLPLAARLSRPLLLVHGTADDNVYFFHSLRLADALLRAGKKPDLLVLPGLSHLALRSADPVIVESVWARTLDHLRAGLGVATCDAGPSRD